MPGDTGTILMVDDNLDNLGFAKASLEAAGHTVIAAADGEEALRLYEEHQSSIALLLTEVVMPTINGFVLANRVLAIDSQLPVVFMSREAWRAYRGLECLAKPLRPAELVQRVSRALNADTPLNAHTH